MTSYVYLKQKKMFWESEEGDNYFSLGRPVKVSQTIPFELGLERRVVSHGQRRWGGDSKAEETAWPKVWGWERPWHVLEIL